MLDGRVEASDGRDHLTALAGAPRPAGGAAEAHARAYCARHLERLGFELTERPFSYSRVPGRWATPAVGVVAALTVAIAATLGASGRATSALAVLAGVLVAVGAGAAWLARYGTTRLRAGRATAVNLEARPRAYGDGGEPTVWLVAHLDSKSQPVPMLLRAAGITFTSVVIIAMLALALAGAVGGTRMLWISLGVVGVLAAMPIAACTVGTRSAGALDNASGVASVLAAAERIPRTRPVGVLLTSAEELGLAGARAWLGASVAASGARFLNCDGVDDDGALVLMYSGRKPGGLLDRALRVASGQGLAVNARRLIPGVLVDAVAFADAGYETFTVSRGTLRTLARIHRPSDDLAHLSGAGIEDAARLLAAVAMDLAET